MGLAKVTAQRWNSLRATAAVSQQTVDEKDADARAKAAEVEAAQSNVDRLKAQKGFANIVAPFDGVVTARNVDIGSLVKAESNDTAALCSPLPTSIRCGFMFPFRNPTPPPSRTA